MDLPIINPFNQKYPVKHQHIDEEQPCHPIPELFPVFPCPEPVPEVIQQDPNCQRQPQQKKMLPPKQVEMVEHIAFILKKFR